MVERKSFDFIQLINGRTVFVKITERGPRYLVYIKVHLSSLTWLVDLLHLACRLPKDKKLVRIRDEEDRVLVFHRKENSRGAYVMLSVTP